MSKYLKKRYICESDSDNESDYESDYDNETKYKVMVNFGKDKIYNGTSKFDNYDDRLSLNKDGKNIYMYNPKNKQIICVYSWMTLSLDDRKDYVIFLSDKILQNHLLYKFEL